MPDDYGGAERVLSIIREEEAVVWLWAEPRLLQWEFPIGWINSPVVGKRRWPGDLWGVDSQGDLIILECKRILPVDPFEDFISFHNLNRPELSSQDLLKRWKKHYRAETDPRFPNCWEERPSRQTKGLVPRSNHRKHIRRWKHLAALINKNVSSPEYKESVKRNLALRDKRDNPPPYYAGLIIKSNQKSAILSQKGYQAFFDLRETAGTDHVNLYIAQAEVVGNHQVEISIRKEEPL